MTTLLAHELSVRLVAFFGVLGPMVAWELYRPRRQQDAQRARRWSTNAGLLAIDAILLRVAFPTAAVGFAMFVERRGWGLLAVGDLPAALKIAIGLILLDLVIYTQHVLLHAVPVLWRLHRVHHTDLAFDATTGVRFHPLEALLSMLIKLAAIAALGAPAAAVLMFEVLLSCAAIFNHGNVHIPPGLDRWLRLLIVTPDMHRVHHSVLRRETDSNYGFAFPWWDRWFGTYRAQPAAGHHGMTIGLEEFRDPDKLRLDQLLVQPFLPASSRRTIGGASGS